MSRFNPLKIAVGKSGRVVIIEGFPDDEQHAGLEDFIEDIELNTELTVEAGMYMAEVEIVNKNHETSNPEYDNVYMDIISVKKYENN